MGGGSEIPVRTKVVSARNGVPDNSLVAVEKNEFRVLVTGFGPFPNGGGHYGENDNTSHLITQLLPDHLPKGNAFNPTNLPIRIINPTAPPGKFVKTEYAYIRSYIQKLYDEYQDTLDAIVHLGMADGWEWFSLEERAFHADFRCDWWGLIEEFVGYYRIPDDVGKTVDDIGKEEGKDMWKGWPMGIATQLSVPRIASEVATAVNAPDESGKDKLKVGVVSHCDPGSYGCGFIYYESLATCKKRGYQTKVLFVHVPGWKDPERLSRGRDVICAVAGAVCQQVSRS